MKSILPKVNKRLILSLLLIFVFVYALYQFYVNIRLENEILKKMLKRMEADSRVAEVLVTDVQYNSLTQEHRTTIKFLEYDTQGRSLKPQYFSFTGNIIQFQSLVVRFEDIHIEQSDPLKGKSIYLFWKVFVLDGSRTQEFVITPLNEIPEGYKLDGPQSNFERKMWEQFWKYALEATIAQKEGIKNAQIEAPGTKFVPGLLYTLIIEHDGGLRIDPSNIPEIFWDEKIIH